MKTYEIVAYQIKFYHFTFIEDKKPFVFSHLDFF